MKFFLTLALVFTIAVSALVPLQQASAEDDKSDSMKAEMMKKWEEAATPSEGHKALEQFIGDWDYTVKWWGMPGAEPEISKGENEVEWILGGRFLLMDVDGTSMGQKFEGMGIMGYDNMKKEYTNVWLDDMSTGMMMATGQYDPGTKTFTEKGTYTDMTTGEPKTFTGITKFIDKDNFTYELFTPGPDGKEFKMMEITYVRDND